jgi:hypothetical protein
VEADVRDAWLKMWSDADRKLTAAKDSPGVLSVLSDAYAGLPPSDRPVVDAVLVDAVLVEDETRRFDALALIGEFRIRAALPNLQILSRRLRDEVSPGAPYELAKVVRIIDRLLERSQ